MSISADRGGEPRSVNATGAPPAGGLKYFRIQFHYGGATKYLRLTGWSEAAALAEFRRHFPEAPPERIEFLGLV